MWWLVIPPESDSPILREMCRRAGIVVSVFQHMAPGNFMYYYDPVRMHA